jgi:hypothetical protein
VNRLRVGGISIDIAAEFASQVGYRSEYTASDDIAFKKRVSLIFLFFKSEIRRQSALSCLFATCFVSALIGSDDERLPTTPRPTGSDRAKRAKGTPLKNLILM